MEIKNVLDALPIHYYVIDLRTKTILQTNNPEIVTNNSPCHQQLFNNKMPCMSNENNCLCEQVLSADNQDEFILEAGEDEEKSYHKIRARKLDETTIMACFTETADVKSVSKELRISQKRFSRAETLASIGSWELDLNTGMISGSKGALDIYGIENATYSFEWIKDVSLPEFREAIDREVTDLVSGRKPYNIKFKILRPGDGEIRYVHSIAEYHKGKNKVFGIIRDITGKVVAEKALQESLSDLRLAQDIARIGNWKYEPGTCRLTVSDTVHSIVNGYELPSQPNLKSFQKLVGMDHLKRFGKAGLNALYKGIPFEEQFKINLPGIPEKWIEIICRPDSEKTPYGFVLKGTVQDITITKTTEDELQRTNNLFSTLLQHLPDAIYMKDTEGRKIIANDGDARHCGRKTADQVIGKTDHELFPPEIAEKYYDDDRQVIESGIPVMNREEVLPGIPKRYIVTTKVPLKDEEGNIKGLVGIGHDITHRKIMEEELNTARLRAEESDRVKSVFLANMSHEIRTPLNGIIGFSNLICSGISDPLQLRSYSRFIENCGQQLTSVIDNIIEVALIQSNQLKLQYSEFNLKELLKDLFLEYRNQKKEHLATIDFRLSFENNAGITTFRSDKKRIFQMLQNLLDNAFKFTREGYIELGCLESGDENLVLYVEDTGIGIGSDKLDVIFENFRQVEEGFTRKYEGAGLGLSIVAGLISKMGGSVNVRSTPGRGSTFYIKIPVCSDEVKETSTEVPGVKFIHTNEKSLQEKLIVSFEDDITSIEYLKSVAGLMDCRLINFVNPVKGIEYLRNNKADLVLMDIRLPKMSGLEATRIIKNEFPNMPVIIQSAYALKEDREKAYSAGCDDYLSKPIPLKDLRMRIKHYIGVPN